MVTELLLLKIKPLTSSNSMFNQKTPSTEHPKVNSRKHKTDADHAGRDADSLDGVQDHVVHHGPDRGYICDPAENNY